VYGRKWGLVGIVMAVLMAVVALGLPHAVMADSDSQPTPPPVLPYGVEPQGHLPGMVQGPDGHWLRVAPDGKKHLAMNAATSGGPDDFGYTWETTTYAWIDATDGTDAGLSGWSWGNGTDAITLPFSFKFYEHTYNSLYIAAAGYVAFDLQNWDSQFEIPSQSPPNNLIAPYATPLEIASSGPAGRVYYKSGGTAPNRFFVVEWYQVPDDQTSGNVYTFEVVLYENGDIVFQYQGMQDSGNGHYWCGSAGIEDDMGLSGLANVPFCDGFPAAGTAVRFYRPDPAARVKAFPLYQGQFSQPGETKTFTISVRNTGEVGADVYEIAVNSNWPVTFYQSDGSTPLTDTDNDGAVDTGEITEGATINIVASVAVPADATVGASNTAAITLKSSLDTTKSKTVRVQAAVPAPFVQAFTVWGNPNLYFARPNGQQVVQLAGVGGWRDGSVIVQTPAGFFSAWSSCDENAQGVSVCEIAYKVLDHEGSPLSNVLKLVNHSTSTVNVYDGLPALAVAPNGRVGLVWPSWQSDGNGNTIIKGYFAEVDAQTGHLEVGPVEVTSVSAANEGIGAFHITATADNHFILAWLKNTYSTYVSGEVKYAVFALNGTLVKAPTSLGAGIGLAMGMASRYEALLAYSPDWDSNITLLVLDHNGNVVQSGITIPDTVSAWPNDLLLLPNGRTAIAWSKWDANTQTSTIQVAVLDDSYGVAVGPLAFAHPAAVEGNENAALTTDLDGHIILTWADGWDLQRSLYYALVDSTGNVLTPPSVFWSGDVQSIGTSWGGQSVTTYLTFGDVSYTHWAATWIERLYNSGITSGCGVGQYCPGNPVTRAQMAVFLERGIHGSDYQPSDVAHSSFGDVTDTYWAKNWIEALSNDGITSGCGNGNYCPNDVVTRAQMAVFLLRAEHGADYQPPHVAQSSFGDVADGYWAKDWIEQLAAEGITSGCGNGNYCPNNAVTRAEMAVFLVRTFGLP